MMKAVRIRVFVDIVSPYSYVACELLVRQGWSFELVPMVLGAVMQASGNRPPATVAAKAAHMQQDLARLGHALGVRLRVPAVFPASSLASQRALTVLAARGDRELLLRAARACWAGYWGGGALPDPNDPVALQAVLAPVVGGAEAARALLAGAEAPEVKAALRSATDEAIAAGAFGAPWIMATDAEGATHCFFGSDRLELLAAMFGLSYKPLAAKM